MKEILIDGEIGYDWWADSGNTGKTVAAQLEGLAPGEEVHVTVNSPGGSVYEGAVIFNLLRDTAKTHPVSVRVNSIAMSMGSYIVLAARTVDKNMKVTVCDNSVVMIHNPWTYTWGDYRDLKKEAEYLEKLAAMYGSVHSFVSGKPDSEIRQAMDGETFYVGKEIFDAGFANDYEAVAPDPDADGTGAAGAGRDGRIIGAKLRFDKAMQKAREAQNKKEAKNDLLKAAAVFQPAGKTNDAESAAGGAIPPSLKNTAGGKMKGEELLAQDKSCYDEVYAKGAAEALEKERARVAAHIKMGETVGNLKAACKFIKEGKSFLDEAVHAEYMALSIDKNRYDARLADNQEGLGFAGESGGGDGEKIAAAFKAGLSGKSLGGANE
jgi:ATP-dependent protease ClpP protease subunit